MGDNVTRDISNGGLGFCRKQSCTAVLGRVSIAQQLFHGTAELVQGTSNPVLIDPVAGAASPGAVVQGVPFPLCRSLLCICKEGCLISDI